MEQEKSFRNTYLDDMLEKVQNGAPFKAPGEQFVFLAYMDTNDHEYDTLTVSMVPMTLEEVNGFSNLIGEAGITEFILTDNSSGLMRDLHYLMAEGWQVEGTFIKEKPHFSFLLGLRMKRI